MQTLPDRHDEHDRPDGRTHHSPTGDVVTTASPIGNISTPLRGDLPRRLLGVWAHPDDEAYLSAGLMARVTDCGGDVAVVTATRGERGTADPDAVGTRWFAVHRERELRASLADLGVFDVNVLGLPDGGCDAADAEQATTEIADAIERFAPDTIVTFGPDGITFHPDHVAVGQWTTEAWRRAGQPGELLYATLTVDHVRTFHDLHQRLGLFSDFGSGRPAAIDASQLALECALTGTEVRRKRQALARHASQTNGLVATIGEATYMEWIGDEMFRRPSPAEFDRTRSMAGARA